jgi:hypothetical protein
MALLVYWTLCKNRRRLKKQARGLESSIHSEQGMEGAKDAKKKGTKRGPYGSRIFKDEEGVV